MLIAVGSALLVAAAAPAAAPAATATVSFPAVADTYVSSDAPNASYGSSPTFTVDGSPGSQAYLRFRVRGLNGRTVVGARLRLYATDASDEGGQVHQTANAWSESMTWKTRPPINPSVLGSFGPVTSGNYYEANVRPAVSGDGPVSFAISSPSADGATWSSRETGSGIGGSDKVPRLILKVESGSQVIDGLSQIAGPQAGSSDPTYYGTQHRLAVSAGGRLLTVHGLHSVGVQLAWRDPAGNWQIQTRGDVQDGILLRGAGTGDVPSSIAVAKDSDGVEHAWVVIARNTAASAQPIYLRRLNGLDSPSGPSVGPLVEVTAPSGGAYKPDIAFEQTPVGQRAAVLWSQRVGDSDYATVIGWLTDLNSNRPTVHNRTVLAPGTSAYRWGTLVPAPGSMNAILRPGTSHLTLFRHNSNAALGSWQQGPPGIAANGFPSATSLSSGEILSAVETDRGKHVVNVQRYAPDGTPEPVELTLSGYAAPTIASDGARAWVVMIRQSDGAVVSRALHPTAGWAPTDRVELSGSRGSFESPNAVRSTDGRLRFVFEAPGSTPETSAVLAFQRTL